MDYRSDSLGDVNILAKLETNYFYSKIPMLGCYKDKTSVKCHEVIYRYSRMPFGMIKGPVKFQLTLNILLN